MSTCPQPHLPPGLAFLLLWLLCCIPNPATAASRQLLAPCSSATSPVQGFSGSTYSAQLSGNNNARGSIDLTVDQGGQQASWNLNLCDVMGYVSSQLHTGSPVLVPLEPYTKPYSASDSGDALPQLCPAQDISGCSYSRQGSFNAGDLVSGSWNDFMGALQAGSVYITISTSDAPSGFMSANLYGSSSSSSSSTPAPTAAPEPSASVPAPESGTSPPAAPEAAAPESAAPPPAPAAPPAAPATQGTTFDFPPLGPGTGNQHNPGTCPVPAVPCGEMQPSPPCPSTSPSGTVDTTTTGPHEPSPDVSVSDASNRPSMLGAGGGSGGGEGSGGGSGGSGGGGGGRLFGG